ncbi:MAG: DUF3592 domain-containing protein [Fulvivirga sp.]|uniref:DUF3592 domain-containing protein n=1 Tax=Fulvivirga sp. TaxID=1931237 RepID=UPI0032EBA749
MNLSPDQKNHLEGLLRAGDELSAVRYLQNTLGLSAEEALKLTEELDKTVEESPDIKMREFMAKSSARAMKDSKVSKWVGGIFLFFGLIMLGVAVYIFYSNYKFAEKAVPVMGKVIGHDTYYSTDDDGNRSLMYSSIFEYAYSGETYTHTSDVGSSSPDYEIGEEAEILIDPEFPGKALVNTFWDRWFSIVIIGFFGVTFSGAGYMVLRLF